MDVQREKIAEGRWNIRQFVPSVLNNAASSSWSFRFALLAISALLLLFVYGSFNNEQVVQFLPDFQRRNVTYLMPLSNALILHYIRLHKDNKRSPEAEFSFTDCMSVLSVMKNLAPDAIYYHTNVPDYWPFDICNPYIKDWRTIKIIDSPLKVTMNGQQIKFIEHEADIKKLESVEKYGGISIDFDVFVINGTLMRELMGKYPCLVCREPPRLNLGFLACKQSGAAYPRLVLKESYEKDYRAGNWIYNSGDAPMKIYQQHNDTAHIVEGACDGPDYTNRGQFNDRRGIPADKWMQKIAHHSFMHDRNYMENTLATAQTSFADMLNWILHSNKTEKS